MFIHTHYSHLSEIVSGEQEPPGNHQEKIKRLVVVCLLSLLNVPGNSKKFNSQKLTELKCQ